MHIARMSGGKSGSSMPISVGDFQLLFSKTLST